MKQVVPALPAGSGTRQVALTKDADLHEVNNYLASLPQTRERQSQTQFVINARAPTRNDRSACTEGVSMGTVGAGPAAVFIAINGLLGLASTQMGCIR
jgi:hypothetical protein